MAAYFAVPRQDSVPDQTAKVILYCLVSGSAAVAIAVPLGAAIGKDKVGIRLSPFVGWVNADHWVRQRRRSGHDRQRQDCPDGFTDARAVVLTRRR